MHLASVKIAKKVVPSAQDPVPLDPTPRAHELPLSASDSAGFIKNLLLLQQQAVKWHFPAVGVVGGGPRAAVAIISSL